MKITRYDEMNGLGLDLIREIGSIGTGNAATALSSMLNKTVRMTLPDVQILGYNEAIKFLGDPEEIVAAILVKMTGEINGLMLFILKMDFINEVLSSVMQQEIEDYYQLNVLETSALEEIGNIIISSYVNAMSTLSEVTINLSVPDIAVNMLGGILSVPMVEFGYQTDKMMMISGQFIIGGKVLHSDLLMMPDIMSLNFLMEKLGIVNG
ncbi:MULTISPECIES: chemotaxis protein CheC [Lacrimispora]|uniref:Chemotaxis protein CheC n=2 Tax=Lacrimispora TaxID=2719231 RepID=A0A2S6HMH9_9FIRM|nr:MULTISPECIES: chemotaxis protein CheC [Clostridia]MBE5976635.1 chemotaxis protein CheC [Paenibacillaceae bacterium]MTK08072.1 chemotaxis protein CheC [Hungatella sp.]MBE5982588.1 chemotaxis protein CheC [Paenibacillaceae bacterium]MBE5988540.1 chemotaxis protein CheC [Paenibacillaceae bacterium]MBE5995275.1 chemotaxis protein CheC [Paenibacillaceae bacterium]